MSTFVGIDLGTTNSVVAPTKSQGSQLRSFQSDRDPGNHDVKTDP